MARHVALLRAVNLGAKRKVPMARLRELLESSGYENVVTHLQSGNAIVTSRRSPESVARHLHDVITREFGFDVPVVVRSRKQLEAVVAAHPPKAGQDPKRYLVTFRPDGTETIAYHEEGVRSQPTDPQGTARNWNTVTRLLELAGD